MWAAAHAGLSHTHVFADVMLSKPLSPVMRETIILVVTRTHRLIEWQQKDSVQDVDWDFNSVIKTTGPASFTDACLKVIERETSWNEAMVGRLFL
jgi:hypothetical protein